VDGESPSLAPPRKQATEKRGMCDIEVKRDKWTQMAMTEGRMGAIHEICQGQAAWNGGKYQTYSS